MTPEAFNTLVQKLERSSKCNPKLYKLRVGLLALLGYAYLFLVVAGLLTTVCFLIWLGFNTRHLDTAMVKVIIVLLIPVFIVLRSLWIRWSPPKGIALSRQAVPQLFELLDDLATNLKAPPFHHVLLNDTFNAGVIQVPRLGIFGWYANYLIIGLPLMQSLSPQQFRAVIAHEMGHLSGNHSRFAGWIYRVRQTWTNVLAYLQSDRHSHTVDIFSRFFSWYAPFFSAYSFVLARADEYEADRCAVLMAGQHNAAEALINVEIRGAYLSSAFWPNLYRQADTQPDPPNRTFYDLAQALKMDLDLETVRGKLALALQEQTNTADTHPCLSDRLLAIGVDLNALETTSPLHQTAADHFLDGVLDNYTQQMSQEWETAVTFQWKERYTYTETLRQTLATLEQKAQTSILTIQETWQRAQGALELTDEATALPLIKAVLTQDFNRAEANYVLGQILAEQSNSDAIPYLEVAMQQNPDVILPACRLITHLLHQQGRESDIEAYMQRAQEHYQLLTLAQQERAHVHYTDEFIAHTLSEGKMADLRQQLAQYPQIQSAYLVCKQVRYLPERAFYVLFVDYRQSFWPYELKDGGLQNKSRLLIEKIVKEVNFPGETWVTLLDSSTKPLLKKVRKVEQRLLFKR